MSDTARVLLTAAVLAASATGFFAWRLGQLDPSGPERLVGSLRLAQFAALLLAATGAVSVGLAVSQEGWPTSTIEVSLGIVFILLGGFVLARDPRDALWLAAAGLLAHALIDIAHRPGLIEPGLAPRWYVVGCAVFDVYIAALCYWVRRR